MTDSDRDGQYIIIGMGHVKVTAYGLKKDNKLFIFAVKNMLTLWLLWRYR